MSMFWESLHFFSDFVIALPHLITIESEMLQNIRLCTDSNRNSLSLVSFWNERFALFQKVTAIGQSFVAQNAILPEMAKLSVHIEM